MSPTLPPGLTGPVDVALARPVGRIPQAGALPGGCRYEPKWDGYRAIVSRDQAGARVWSRRGTDMSATFPEITAAAVDQLAPGTVLDGELVAWVDEHLDFSTLQTRMGHGARGAARLARQRPASYAMFDLLCTGGRDTRPLPFDERRALLGELAAACRPPLNLSPVTADRATAVAWFETYAAAGVEGLVVKGGAQAYQPAKLWMKVKHRASLDVVCGAVIGTLASPQEVVAGLPIDGRLRIVGRAPLSASARRALVPWLAVPVGEHPWPSRLSSAALGRFNTSRGDVVLTLVEPIVIEVSADVAWDGQNFRHPLRFGRPRPDAEVGSVTPPPAGPGDRSYPRTAGGAP
jgi:ATP dependent DNA ligase domain